MIFEINEIDNVTLFWYTIIFFGTIYVFSRIDIKLNVLYGTLVVVLLLVFLNNKYKNTKQTTQEMLETKTDLIIPHGEKINKYDDIINFLFSIQDFYIYNPQAYEDLVEAIDIFFIYYEEILNNNSLASVHYNILDDKRRLALNSLQSIIFNFPVNVQYNIKLNKSVELLDTILQNYMQNVKLINDNNIYVHGYTLSTKIITNDKIIPYNSYDEPFKLY